MSLGGSLVINKAIKQNKSKIKESIDLMCLRELAINDNLQRSTWQEIINWEDSLRDVIAGKFVYQSPILHLTKNHRDI